MALVPTPGSANADTYATLTEANTYHSTKRSPLVAWWTTATDGQKESALRMAALLLDSMFKWSGAAVDATQNLAWPRTGMLTRNGFAIGTTVIPQSLKDAQAEYAGQLGTANLIADNDAAKQGIASVKAGSVAVTFQSAGTDLESVNVQALLKQSDMAYLSKAVPDSVRFLLVPTWYAENQPMQPFDFEAN